MARWREARMEKDKDGEKKDEDDGTRGTWKDLKGVNEKVRQNGA